VITFLTRQAGQNTGSLSDRRIYRNSLHVSPNVRTTRGREHRESFAKPADPGQQTLDVRRQLFNLLRDRRARTSA